MPVRDIEADTDGDAFLEPRGHVPFHPAHPPVGSHLAALEPNQIVAGCELGQRRQHGLDIVRMDIVEEWPRKRLLV